MNPASGSAPVGVSSHMFAPTEMKKDCNHVQYGPYSPASTITWASNNTPVVTVDSTGVETTVAPGSGQITAQWQEIVAYTFRCGQPVYGNVGCGATCDVVPIVNALQASLPSTQNAITHVAPAADVITSTNASTAFATASSADLVVVFQGSGTLTVTAAGVSPQSAASQLRWTIQRDPSDSVDVGLPTLSAQTGPQITVNPSLTGNFILICYFDSNGNGVYDAGESLSGKS
jgi:hypothetical protein